MPHKHHGLKFAGLQNNPHQRDARRDAQQHSQNRREIALPQHQRADLPLVIAQHLQRGVVPYPFREVHQAHVVADDEGQAQRRPGHNRKRRGRRVQQRHAVHELILQIPDSVHLVHLVDPMQAHLVRPLQQQCRHLKLALPQLFPGRPAHKQALPGVGFGEVPYFDGDRLGFAYQDHLDGIPQLHAHHGGQLPADHRPLLRQRQNALVGRQAVDRLVIRHHRQQAGPVRVAAAERHAFLHDALHGLRAQAAPVALRPSRLSVLQVHPQLVGERSPVILPHEPGDGFLQAEGRDDQHVAADDSHQQDHRPPLVAQEVPDDHLAVEGKALPQARPSLQKNAGAAPRRLGPQQVRRLFP